MTEKKRSRIDACLSILELLARAKEEEPLNKYEIEKEAKIEHKEVYNLIKDLKEIGHIRVVKTEKSRVGLPVEFYDVTFLGLAAIFQGNKKKIDMRHIAAKYKSFLPLVFGKWDHFVNLGAEEAAIELLKASLQNPIRSYMENLEEVVAIFNGAGAFTEVSEIDFIRFFKDLKKDPDYERIKGVRKRFPSLYMKSVYKFYFANRDGYTGYILQQYKELDWQKVIAADPEMLKMALFLLDIEIRKAFDHLQFYNDEKKLLISKSSSTAG